MNVLTMLEMYQKVVNRIRNNTKRQVCRLRLSPEAFSITDSHMGGIPYCPHDGKIPENKNGGQLWLCAQINFAEMPKMDDFPSSGILQIFLSEFNCDGGFGLYSDEWTIQDNWRAVYYAEVDETVTFADVAKKMRTDWKNKDFWHIPGLPLKINFYPVADEGITEDDYRFHDMFQREFEELFPHSKVKAAEFDIHDIYKLCKTVEERDGWDKIARIARGNGCKIGGYPAFEQEDIRLYKEEHNWDVLLLQIDDRDETADDALYLGGYGIANFWMRPEDLKNMRFENIGADWATS